MKHNVVYENKNEDLVSSLEILKSKLNSYLSFWNYLQFHENTYFKQYTII